MNEPEKDELIFVMPDMTESESAKHFDEPIPWREETWRDRPPML